MADHLDAWLGVREQVAWDSIVPRSDGPVRAVRNGFAVPRLYAVQEQVRSAVAGGAELTVELLAGWNGAVRAVAAPGVRRGTAYAKNGRERYGLRGDTWERFADCLAQAGDPGIPVAARAARAYLDVAFFHPFDDGNARLAALVMQFVLLREGVELDDVTLLLTLVRHADDAEGAAGLARMIHGMAAATRRRSLRSERLETADGRLERCVRES